MRFYDIELSLRPENTPPKWVLQSLHMKLKYRYYYLAFPFITTVLSPLILKASKLICRHLSEDNSARVWTPIIFFSLYINAIENAVSLFSFGTHNRFDPLITIIGFDARYALNILTQKAPRIYENNVFKMIAESPEYTDPNLKIQTNIKSIDDESPYTPLKLANEIGALNIIDMFDKIAYEEKIISLLLHSYLTQNSILKRLNNDIMVHILSYFAGSKISELKFEAPDTELGAVTIFAAMHAKKQRDRLPKLLICYESKIMQARQTNSSALHTSAFSSQLKF